ncbi:MAG: hypothetical protein OXR68_00635 [Alphaproteobacteria bacterium]|nr:hypothetical protein [Alphaproteobacteria bacterium]MDD9919117.1 hypothetical protein [Alphaproteobacteria bacterium]
MNTDRMDAIIGELDRTSTSVFVLRFDDKPSNWGETLFCREQAKVRFDDPLAKGFRKSKKDRRVHNGKRAIRRVHSPNVT